MSSDCCLFNSLKSIFIMVLFGLLVFFHWACHCVESIWLFLYMVSPKELNLHTITCRLQSQKHASLPVHQQHGVNHTPFIISSRDSLLFHSIWTTLSFITRKLHFRSQTVHILKQKNRNLYGLLRKQITVFIFCRV